MDALVAHPAPDGLPSLPAALDATAATPTPTPTPAVWTLLCVDDEPNIVSALRRLFRSSGYRVLSALSGDAALELMAQQPVDLIISDMRMPGMDGAQLLERVRLGWPDTTRLLLTGHADMQSTVAAINRGEVYRYISKPWNDDWLVATVAEAFERQRLQRETRRLEALTEAQNAELKQLNASLEQKVADRTERLSWANDRLTKNYMTSIKAFSHLIGLRERQPASQTPHAARVAGLARRTAGAMGMCNNDQQAVMVAGLLHDIGHIGLADSLLARSVPRMSAEEQALYRRHPVLGEQALMALDDMQAVAALVRAHHERHDGRGFPDGIGADEIPLGARILAVADAFADLQSGHLGARLDAAQARTIIARGRGSAFDPEVLDIFLQVALDAASGAGEAPAALGSAELLPGMVLARELVSAEGVMLLAADQVLTADLIDRIRRHERRDNVSLVLLVRPLRQGGPRG